MDKPASGDARRPTAPHLAPAPAPDARRASPRPAASATAEAARPKPSARPCGGPPTGAELATAFDGRLEPVRPSILYHASTFLVFLVMVLLPLVYVAIVVAAAAGVWWYAVHATAMFEHVRGRAAFVVGVAYVAPLIAGGMLVLFMILPLFWRSAKRERTFWVDRREQPLLYAYIDKLCDTMRAPRPARIDVTADANASAHIDNGLMGLFSRRLVLTIGLPLAESMDLRRFTGVIAHELGHFSQGVSMRLSYAVHLINNWFVRLAYGRGGLDDAIDAAMGDEPWWPVAVIGLTARLTLGIARTVLKLMALLSHAVSMQLSRQAEFDADRQAARVVGSDAMGGALETIPYLATASALAVERAQQGWSRRALPDDLVVLTDAYARAMPAPVKEKIAGQILAEETGWFDTHPPLFKRIATLKKAGLQGVLKVNAAATCLFREYDELRKMATLSLYQGVLGETLQPEHLVPVEVGNRAS